MKCAQNCVNLQKEKEEVLKKLNEKKDKIDFLKKELEKTKSEYEMAQKRIVAMNQQLSHTKEFEKEKKKEIQANTMLRNTLESGTLVLQSEVEKLTGRKEPMVDKLRNYEEYTTRAYNEIILLLQMRGATERGIEENKRKLIQVEEEFNKQCKLYKILNTMMRMYEKGIEKLLEDKKEAENSGVGEKAVRSEFAKKVVEFIGELDKEIPLDALEKITDYDATQKSLERNSQLMKRAKMVIEKERLNNRIEQNFYKLAATQRLEGEAINTLTRENIKLISERNLLKQKCGELETRSICLENGISDLLAQIKDTTIDMGEQLEQNVQVDLVEKIKERHKMLMRKQGKRTKLSEVLGKNYEQVLGLTARREKSASTGTRGDFDKLIKSARIQRGEMKTQRDVLTSIKMRTTELAKVLSPINATAFNEKKERERLASRGSERKSRQISSSQEPIKPHKLNL